MSTSAFPAEQGTGIMEARPERAPTDDHARREADASANPTTATEPPPLNAARTPDVRAYVYLGIMIVLGSTTSPLAQVAVRQLPIGLVPLLRFGSAGLCLLPFLGGLGPVRELIRRDWRRLALVAACCVPINQFFFLTAAKLGTNAHVGLFYATVPLVVWILAWGLGHEPLDLARLGGILISITGVLVIGLGNILGADAAASPAQAHAVMVADLLLIGAVISWGAYVALSRPLIVRHGALPTLAGTFLVGCLLQVPISVLTAPGWGLQLRQASTTAWVCLGILALVMTPINLALQNLSLRRLDASQVATFSNVAPVLTVVWGVWLFGEALSPALVVGGLLTLAGVFWTSRPAPRRAPAVAPVATPAPCVAN
ncbi:DMT family transporter [Planctomyces sp. SH-PL62]|uniref:DMT family transporter n=1 Tax=Planctomyces sp. SH-PL62 TaxID=1636152 RepID=UPI00078B8764|nr:DMT family transporter [Planctomyces sp. SH-PL62]AMV37974.1 putative DMT superfamily transporter inner membrane protein [Planctomyces sp. SH-PL62]